MHRNLNPKPPRRQPATCSINDTAYLLGVSPRTVQREISRGSLHSLKIGNRRLVPRTELDRLLGKSWREGGAA